MLELIIKPINFFNEPTKKKILLVNIFWMLIFNSFLTSSLCIISNWYGFNKWLSTFIIIFIIICPFIFITSFIISTFWSLITLFMHKTDLSIKKMYFVTLSAISIMLFLQSILFIAILTLFKGDNVNTLIIVCTSLIFSFISLRIVYYGFIYYVKLSKKFTTIFVTILYLGLFSLNLISLLK